MPPAPYSCLENPIDRGAWWATVHGSQRVGHDCATKQQQYSGEYSIYIVFISLSVDRPFGCVHILALVTNAAVNLGVHVSCQVVFSFSSDT